MPRYIKMWILAASGAAFRTAEALMVPNLLMALSFGEQSYSCSLRSFGANISNFMVSYNYSYQSGAIRLSNGGFHQITLGYDFGQTERKYDCYCPAAQ